MTIREYMAKKLHGYRNARGLSVTEVGNALGKSPKTISAWEVGRGQPDADMLMQLCYLYGVSISDFYPDEDMTDEARDEIALLDAYRSLDAEMRQSILDLITKIAKSR